MIERRVYSSWAFSENEREKAKINYDIYKNDLKPKVKYFWGDNIPTEEDLKNFMCYKCSGHGYAHTNYQILSNPYKFTNNELALICDDGNLCFGYRGSYPNITIHTD